MKTATATATKTKKTTYEMNGKPFNTLAEIATELGVARIRPANFDKYGITQVVPTDAADDTTPKNDTNTVGDPVPKSDSKNEPDTQPTPLVDTDKPDNNDKPDKKTAGKAGKGKNADKTDTQPDKDSDQKPVEPDILDMWRAAGAVDNTLPLEDFAKKLRKATVVELETFAKAKSLKLYDDVDNEPIRRMRLIMALKESYYPNEKLETKKSSDFRKITLDKLVAKAADMKLEYKQVDNASIQRMWVTKALVEAGITPEDIEPKAAEPNTLDASEAKPAAPAETAKDKKNPKKDKKNKKSDASTADGDSK